MQSKHSTHTAETRRKLSQTARDNDAPQVSLPKAPCDIEAHENEDNSHRATP